MSSVYPTLKLVLLHCSVGFSSPLSCPAANKTRSPVLLYILDVCGLNHFSSMCVPGLAMRAAQVEREPEP